MNPATASGATVESGSAARARLPFARTTLSLGEGGRVVSWCDDGFLVAEYLIFEAGDLVLRTGEGVAVFEAGYRTTARRAVERLARAGITPATAEDAARAIPHDVVRALARCEAVRSVANRLGAAELLDGARFSVASGAYQGAWIDLKRLSDALNLTGASMLFQALFTATVLSEVPGSTPVFLSTITAMQERRPSERSFCIPAMPSVDDLLDGLANLAAFAAFETRRPEPPREARMWPALLARIHERRGPGAAPALRAHLEALEAVFLACRPPPPAAPAERRAPPEPPPPEPPPAPAAAPTAIVLHKPALPSIDRLGGIVSPGVDRGRRYVPELVESLVLPEGADESLLDRYAVPKTPLEARVAMTRLARDLGRDYRVRHGKVLRCDVLAVDIMQQQLLRLVGASLRDRDVAWQLRRHGALLSEIYARALGGVWIDLGHREPAYWMMRLPPDLHTRPVGCVFQFVAAGNRASDLVGQFMELKKRAAS